jgi:hydrogenase/urease accessory protein HupE
MTIDAHAGAPVAAYLTLGIEHILTGPDHLLFVFGLILLTASLSGLLRTITAFTVAHSITLALTALGLMSVNPHLIEALVALSILFVAVELVRKQRGYDGVTQRYPWLIAFAFGLLHGAAFAGALKEIGLPKDNIPGALFLFNLGVELGQLAFVLVVTGLLWILRRVPLPTVAPRLGEYAATYAIGSFSMFWVFERLEAALRASGST